MGIEQTRDNSGIYIDLIKQNNVVYPEESLFQRQLYDKLNALLDAQWNFLQNIPEDQKKKISRCRVHNAILVYGKRGSGKTVFISNIENNIKENHYEFLDIVDPTLLSDSKVIDGCEAFCSVLIGILHEYLKEKVFKNTVSEQDKNTYTKKFREVADCLSSLKNAKDESGLDSIFFHGDAIALEQKLHEFFEVVSKQLLDGKMLCFRLDDIDMSLKSGFLCLETMRKYFSSPWVIPIVCGDIDLYQKLVEKEYWKPFSTFDANGKSVVPYGEGKEFSSKYLTKIFPNNLRLEIVSCADFVRRKYDQIFFVFHDKEDLIDFKLKDIDDYIDAYFNPGIGLDQYKDHALSSLRSDKADPSVVRDSLRVWMQFHEKMFPVYNKIANTKAVGQNSEFDRGLYSQFQEFLADFFDSQQKFQVISELARININSISAVPEFNYNYKTALTALSEAEDLLGCSEGQSISDKGLRLSLPFPEGDFFDDDKMREMFPFLLQLFSCDNNKEEAGKYLEVFSGRFVHFIFSTLFQKDCNIGEILFETPLFCPLNMKAWRLENYDDNDDDAHDDLPPEQFLAGEKADDLWERIVNKYPYVGGGSKPFFDVNFLRSALGLFYDNLNAYRKKNYDGESILDYMMRCVVMLLHSVYTCERKDFTTYKKIGLAKNQNNFWDNKKKKINPDFFPEISLLVEGHMESSISYYLFNHPLVKLINSVSLKYYEWKNEGHETKPYLPIDYLRQGISDTVIRQKVATASSLDEINEILMSLSSDKQAMTIISKFTQRSNAFKRIKMLYYKDTTSESSRALYDKLCRTNVLTNLVPTSPAWEKCVIDD